MVEPIDPVEGRERHRLQAPPRAAGAKHLGLVPPDDGLGQGVVVRIANAPHRWLDAGLGQAFGVADGQRDCDPRSPWWTRVSQITY